MDYQTLNEIIENSKDIAYECDLELANHSQSARHLVYGEITTFQTTLELCDKNCFKECFILLRSCLEKLLFFWLILDGKKYRGRKEYNILPIDNKSGNERRDEIYNKWINLWKQGDENFIDIKSIDKGSKTDNKIIVTFETIGLFEKKGNDKKNKPVPFYNFILETYKPKIAYLGKLKLFENDITSKRSERIKAQKYYYTYYFYFQNILENLLLNNLINKEQMEQILVHYNFISSL